MSDLTPEEVELLEVMAGEREGSGWGAWITACLESLKAGGYCTRGPRYTITDKGRAALAAIRGDN